MFLRGDVSGWGGREMGFIFTVSFLINDLGKWGRQPGVPHFLCDLNCSIEVNCWDLSRSCVECFLCVRQPYAAFIASELNKYRSCPQRDFLSEPFICLSTEKFYFFFFFFLTYFFSRLEVFTNCPHLKISGTDLEWHQPAMAWSRAWVGPRDWAGSQWLKHQIPGL